MKLINDKKNIKIEDPISLINDCISGLDEIKKKIYHQNDVIKTEYYTQDELDEYINWNLSFKQTDFVK